MTKHTHRQRKGQQHETRKSELKLKGPQFQSSDVSSEPWPTKVHSNAKKITTPQRFLESKF